MYSMLRYSLRTLVLIVLIAGPLLAWGWGCFERAIEERREAERAAERDAAIRAQDSLTIRRSFAQAERLRALHAKFDLLLSRCRLKPEIKPERDDFGANSRGNP